MRIIVDENVSYSVVEMLKYDEHEVLAIAETSTSGIRDEDIFNMAVQKKALLVTRDHHFRNPIRFRPEKTAGILYIRHGNIKASEEMHLIQSFMAKYKPNQYKGRLVTLFRGGVKIQ